MRLLRLLALWLAAAGLSAGATKPSLGIKTPGTQVPFQNLKAVAELPVPAKPEWLFFAESLFVPNAAKDLVEKIDPKTNKPADPLAGVKQPCAGMAAGFGSVWVPACGSGSLVRFDDKTWKETARLEIGTARVTGGITASPDSIWLLTDTKTTLARIDPDQNQVVAEIRLPAGCKGAAFGETALWLVCPDENKVYRIDPATNLLAKQIEVSGLPQALTFGDGSVWVLCRKDGKVDRIDPKTNKVSKTIDLGLPGIDGTIAFGEGSLWVSMVGFPITRIQAAPEKEKVVQQFYGAGGGALVTSTGALWLSNLKEGTLWRIDPKRVPATLAE